MGSRSVIVVAIIATVACVTTARADAPVDHAALRDVLGEAPTIVRASASETTSAGTTDTRVLVLETLRGAVEGDTIIVRQPAGEEPLSRGDDAILLLDPRGADGAYPLHHPAGRYRVEAGADGDDVIVNANGIDGTAVSPKDLRPRAPDERIPLATFRTLVGPTPRAPTAARPDPALSAPAQTTHAPATGQPAPLPDPDPPTHHARWPWVVFGACLGLAVAVFARRRRR
jgi:hypothetical protein